MSARWCRYVWGCRSPFLTSSLRVARAPLPVLHGCGGGVKVYANTCVACVFTDAVSCCIAPFNFICFSLLPSNTYDVFTVCISSFFIKKNPSITRYITNQELFSVQFSWFTWVLIFSKLNFFQKINCNFFITLGFSNETLKFNCLKIYKNSSCDKIFILFLLIFFRIWL